MNIREQEKCPECGTNWNNGNIPLKDRKHYKPPYFFSRIIGIEDPTVYDGVSWWLCPDCKTKWDRWTNEKVNEK